MLQLLEAVVTADFLNHPQRNPGIGHLGESHPPKIVDGGSLDVGSLESFSQNLVR